jgi:uncharacterized integral membrane protein
MNSQVGQMAPPAKLATAFVALTLMGDSKGLMPSKRERLIVVALAIIVYVVIA